MRKKENSGHKLFNLDEDVQTIIKECSSMNGMSQSEFIEFLVNSWDEGINPIKKLKKLRANKSVLSEELKNIESQENLIMDSMERVEEWKKIKQESRPMIVSNLARMIINDDKYGAENVAKNQSIRLGVPATDLLFEALDIIKKRKEV